MSRLRQLALAIIGRDPMSFTEALVLVVTGGSIVLALFLTGFVPRDHDPFFVWAIWIVVVLASVLLMLRGALAIAGAALRVASDATSAVGRRLPFEVHAPLVRKAALPLREPPRGMLDFERAAMDGMKQISRTLEGLSNDMADVNEVTKAYTPRFASLRTASVERKIKIAREYARKLDKFTGRMEARQAALRTQIDSMSTNFLLRIEGVSDPSDLDTVESPIATMRDVTKKSRVAMNGYRQAVVGVRTLNLQASFNEAVDRQISVATEIVSDMDATVRFANKALSIIREKRAARKGRR